MYFDVEPARSARIETKTTRKPHTFEPDVARDGRPDAAPAGSRRARQRCRQLQRRFAVLRFGRWFVDLGSVQMQTLTRALGVMHSNRVRRRVWLHVARQPMRWVLCPLRQLQLFGI